MCFNQKDVHKGLADPKLPITESKIGLHVAVV